MSDVDLRRLFCVPVLVLLKHRWWTQGECDEFKETTTSTEELDLLNVAGVFLVLVIGVVLAAIVCLIEFLMKMFYHRKKQVN